MLNQLHEALAYLQERVERVPTLAIVLGSGLGGLASEMDPSALHLDGALIPHYPRSTVAGHTGSLIFGKLAGVEVVLQSGRVHLYEGYSPQEVVFPVRLLALLGVRTFLLTNACGGIAAHLEPGNLCLLRDHINLTGQTPLRGPNHDELGPRFFDMGQAYTPELRRIALAVAVSHGIRLGEGVYAAMMGPAYETPAEILMCRALGADVVGMSTVPEVLALAHMGREVVAISCVTNKAAGLADERLNHEDVVQTGRRAQATLTALVSELAVRIQARR